MKKHRISVTVITFLGVVCGCQPEGPGQYAVDYPLAFDVAVSRLGSSSGTKSSELLTADGSLTLPLSCTVSEGIALSAFNQDALKGTKGTQVNTTDATDTLSKYVSVTGGFFRVAAFNSSGSRFIPGSGGVQFDEVKFNSTSKTWAIDGMAYTWKGMDEKKFFAYANMPENEAGVVEASVACADSTAEVLTYTTVPTEPARQRDILLGYYKGTGKYDADNLKGGIAEITFYHPMTAVKFVMGDFKGVGTVKIKAIRLSNVYKSGEAEITPASVEEADPDDKVIWTPGSGMQAVKLGNGTDTLAIDSETKVIGGEDGVFLLIPQDFTSKPVTVDIAVELDGEMTSLHYTLTTGKWKAGYTNTYTLGYDSKTYT